jgi:oxygen-independent coproporphyrinogen-3 oxidase
MTYSLYFHIPFCVHRCAYCDFNTYAGQETLIPAYVSALCCEIEFVARHAPGRLTAHTIFFGGGTPSLLTPKQFEQILQTVHVHFDLSDPETSLEANPGTVTPASLRELRAIGFNRVSFGIQSAHPEELHQLERIHDFFDVIQSVKWARQAGFENLNLDLIFGLPEQTLSRWQASLRRGVDLAPEHLSLYALTVEHGTPFGRWAARGLMPMPDPDLAADMYELAGDFLSTRGYEQYEISNWAQSKDEGRRMKDEISTPPLACRHNLQYWRNQPYLGFGAGAHSCANGVRYSNAVRIKTYIERLTSHFLPLPFPLTPATVNQTKTSLHTEMQETMMLGLRLTREGVSVEEFRSRFGAGMMEIFGKEINELIGVGLVEWVRVETSEVLRLTKRGRLLGNQVFMRFVD